MVPALESDEVTVENVRVLGSAIVTVKAGMRTDGGVTGGFQLRVDLH